MAVAKRGIGKMAKWICKVSRSGESIRVTLPKGLVQEAGWGYVEFVKLEVTEDLDIVMRGFADGESIKSKSEADRAGADRHARGKGEAGD